MVKASGGLDQTASTSQQCFFLNAFDALFYVSFNRISSFSNLHTACTIYTIHII
jgi:hypothetical protein